MSLVVGVNVLASTNRSVSSHGARSAQPCARCVGVLRLAVRECSVARLRLKFHPLYRFYLHVAPRKEGTWLAFSRNSKFVSAAAVCIREHERLLTLRFFGVFF